MTFWKKVESALIEKKISEAELGRRIGIAQPSINSWKTRGSIPRADIAIRLAKELNTTVEYLFNATPVSVNSAAKRQFLVPVLNQSLSAGKGDLLPESDSVQGLLEVPAELRKYGQNLAGLYVHGDSMEPTLRNGDLVICSSSGWDNGEGIYAVRFNGKGYVKRIQVKPNKIILKSDNPAYEPIEEPLDSDDYSVIGKVLYVMSKV